MHLAKQIHRTILFSSKSTLPTLPHASAMGSTDPKSFCPMHPQRGAHNPKGRENHRDEDKEIERETESMNSQKVCRAE